MREEVQKAKVETENLEMLLRERQIEVENCKKEIELQGMEKQQLEKRVGEVRLVKRTFFFLNKFFLFQHSNLLVLKLLERCKNVDVEDYDRLKDEVQHTQVKLILMLFSYLFFLFLSIFVIANLDITHLLFGSPSFFFSPFFWDMLSTRQL